MKYSYGSYLKISKQRGTNIMIGLRELLLKEQFRLEEIMKDTKTDQKKLPKEDYAYQKVMIMSSIIGVQMIKKQETISQKIINRW